MADTARRGDDVKEYFDSAEELDRKVALVAKWMTESKATMAFTGAGISTAAGIPDFRSGMDTCLKTGPGVWELDAHKAARPSEAETVDSTLVAIPTPTHMLLCAMEEAGLLQHLSSQNVDGLHRRSGFPPEKLSELHGNSNLETCGGRATKKGGPVAKGCGRAFLRDYDAIADYRYSVFDHRTGRKCPSCSCDLHDSIINFGENLPGKDLTASFAWADRAEVCLAMGSSLTVTPAADIPYNVTKRSRGRGGKAGKLVVVNLQRTPLDDDAALVVHAKCEEFSEKLAAALGLKIPPFRLNRFVKVRMGSAGPDGLASVKVSGEDVDGTPFELVRKMTAETGGTAKVTRRVGGDAGGFYGKCKAGASSEFRVQFFGHYGELPLHLHLAAGAGAAAAGGGGDATAKAAAASPAGTGAGDAPAAATEGKYSSCVLKCVYDPLAGNWVSATPVGDGGKFPAWLRLSAEKRRAVGTRSAGAAAGGGGSSRGDARAKASAASPQKPAASTRG